jgi:hypothetical protein
MLASSRVIDPLTAFTNLTTVLPQWISELHSLSEYASKKHEFFVAEYARLLANAQPKQKRVRSPSLCSLHTNDDPPDERAQVETDGTEPSRSNSAGISPFEPGNKYLYAQARRKRKPGSSVRSSASGPPKFRSKHKVIVYYDKYIQDQLDIMVKKIGGARNELRKAKTANIANQGFQLPRLGRRYDTILPSWAREDLKLPTPVSEKSAIAPEQSPDVTAFDPVADSTFASADHGLEAVQTICETAAHQFLRDGDCRTTLDSAPKKLDSVLELANKATQQLEEAAKKKKESETEQVSHLAESDATCEKPSTEGVGSKLAPSVGDPVQPLGLGTMEIEVDDNSDDGSTIDIDIIRFRMARNRGLRA